MTRKISLRLVKVADKGLMPEILPDPHQARQPAAAARDRVRSRLRQMRDSAAVLAAAAASLGTGCGEQHRPGDQPPPAGSGTGGDLAAGSGGSGQAGNAGSGKSGAGGRAGGGVAGYAVVDPMPLPFIMCEKPPVFVDSNTMARWAGSSALAITSSIPSMNGASPYLQGVRTDATNVQAAVITSSYPPTAQLTLQSGNWPQTVKVTLVFMCQMSTGGYGTYEVTLRLDTSKPAEAGTVPIMFAAEEDAGT